MRKAIEEYDMIDDGDTVTVGLSGGKDSLALVAALARFGLFSPKKFALKALTVDMGLGADFSPLERFCADLDVPYEIIKTDIGEVIFDIRKEKSPCSLCSKMRRGALCGAIAERGGGKLALGHHADDVAETFLLSLLLEKDIIPVAREFPVVKNPCPSNHTTKREYMKNLLKTLGADIPKAKESVLTALFHPERNNLWDKNK